MSFTRLFAGLILISDFAMMYKGNKDVKWGINLDYIAVCSMILLVVGFGIDIWKTVKDRNSSHEEHSSLKENQSTNKELLAKDHSRISSEIGTNSKLLLSGQSSISQSTSEIRTSVESIDKQIAVETARRENMFSSMTEDQKNVHNQINAIYALNQQIPKLEYEKQQLQIKYQNLSEKYEKLEMDYDLLKEENQQLEKELNSENSQDLTEDYDE